MCVDETCDILSATKLIVYGRYFVEGDVHTSFVNILELQDGSARSIVDALFKLCEDRNNMCTCLCSLGSDDTSVTRQFGDYRAIEI